MNNGISIPNGAWMVVADYSKALFLENTGPALAPVLELKQVMEAPDNPLTHEQGTDRPGRAFNGSHRSAVEQTDFHALAGKRFMTETAEALDRFRTENGIEAIVLVAPPKALADLRGAISSGVRSSVVGEVDKDLVKKPVIDIARHFTP